jgi:hypothetical protein
MPMRRWKDMPPTLPKQQAPPNEPLFHLSETDDNINLLNEGVLATIGHFGNLQLQRN